MSAITYSISFQMAEAMNLSQGITAEVLPLMRQAVGAIAQQAVIDWRTAVHGARLWSVERDEYARSINWQWTGDFSARVEADYDKAAEIETGRPARDLKKMLDTSQKVRRTTDGRRFLVIPMRHNTPGNGALARPMPKAIYNLASAMAPSTVTSSWRKRRSGEVTTLSPTSGMHPASKQTPYLSRIDTRTAATTKRFTYAWGDRLTAGAIKAAGGSAEDVRRLKGLVKMDTSTPGGGKSSSYMTFRIMMDSQTGKWIIPAKPGLYLARNVAQALQPKALAAFQAAIQKTVSG